MMKEGSETKDGWKGLPFYMRVTIAGLLAFLVFALLFTGLSILALVPGGVDSDAVERIVFYFLLMIPTVVVVVLTWRSRQTLIAAIGAILAGCGRTGFRGDGRAAGETALLPNNALSGGVTACGGPRPRGL